MTIFDWYATGTWYHGISIATFFVAVEERWGNRLVQGQLEEVGLIDTTLIPGQSTDR